MKRISLVLLSVLLAALLCFSSCTNKSAETPDGETTTNEATNETSAKEGIWASAVYSEDTVLGEGDVTVFVEVKAEERAVTFTIKTDKTILGDALIENELVKGEQGDYGLYIKEVNGILADYSLTQSYWSFYIDGEIAITGVDGTKISEGGHYELVYTTESA